MIQGRRRAVNSVQRQRLVDLAARLSCFDRDEFVFLPQTGKNYARLLINHLVDQSISILQWPK